MPSPTQAEMDAELIMASTAGISFWAFVAYPAASGMSRALSLYLSSHRRHEVSFCLFAQLDSWGTAGAPGVERARHVSLMGSDSYLRVRGRPLYFLGFVSRAAAQARWGSFEALRNQIAAFRSTCSAAGVGDPYVVVAGSLDEAGPAAVALAADAVGSYSIANGRAIGTYSDLAAYGRTGWRRLSSSGLPVVPTVMTGWDRRPRVATPVPWEREQAAGAGMEYGYTQAPPGEIAALLRDALSFDLNGRPPAVLIYAWNEHDEGGWLVPTAGCNATHLSEVASVLRPSRPPLRPLCVLPPLP